jgi:hypothetical protein
MTETASIEASSPALPLVAWSHVWSPLVSAELRRAAWEALALPVELASCEQEYWETFQVGSPRPLVSLLLHTTLGQPGPGAREDWLRVMNHLGLDWSGAHLPPDHLGPACEIYACAVARDEKLLSEELRQRYLLPWCDAARERLKKAGSELVFLPEHFKEDLEAA